MKNKVLTIVAAITLFIAPKVNFAQAPNLGTAADFELFTSVGAITNTGISQITGNVGSNVGASTGFGNVNGVMDDQNGASGKCATDLLTAYNQLNAAVATFFPANLLGNGQILNAGVYSIAGPATLNLGLTLDAQSNPNAVFIFKIQGAFSTNPSSKVHLINGALACNVFWKVEGLVSMAAGTTMRGTVIANNAAISMSSGDTLEGRALSTAGAIGVDGVLAYTPIGCGSPTLAGPVAPTLASTACYELFSSIGPVTNTGVTNITGDIGTNSTSPTGFDPLLVVGTIHLVPDASTAKCASDLLNVYNYLNGLVPDIELLFPAQFGNDLVLTPHTYIMKAAVTFTDTLYLNAEGDANAVFVIQVKGAFSTSVNSKVNLINGALAQNVFWMIDGAVSINNNSVFNGTIICNNGAINLTSGVQLNGRALTTDGAVACAAVNAVTTPGCGAGVTSIITQPVNQIVCAGSPAVFTVSATGTGLSYQWRNGNLNLINGGAISGANSASLTINPSSIAEASTQYNVIISGSTIDTSVNVSLVVNTAPVITTQPSNIAACAGNSVSFSVIATGTAITYQWRKGIILLNNAGSVSGVTSPTLTINPVNITDSASDYNVIISGTCAPNDTSINVALAVNTLINTQPKSKIVCTGGSVSFTVAATGTGLTYQWEKGAVLLSNGGAISGANSPTLTINPVGAADASSNYKVLIIGSCAPNDTSVNVSLKVNTAPAITVQPVNQVVCVGSPVNFSVTATGIGLTYQWRNGTVDLISGGNILDATAPTLTINPVTNADTASNYNVVINGGCFPNDTSINVSLKLNNPIITSQPVNQTVCSGSSVSFSVVATGTGLTYQWRNGKTNLGNAGAISGANLATLTINPVSITDTSSEYNVVITGTCSPNDTSISVSLKVNTAPQITTEPSNQVICAGGNVIFSVSATGTGLSYQWRKGTLNLIDGGDIFGSGTSTLIFVPAGNADTASDYNVIVSGTCAPNDTSINVSLKVNNAPVITSEPSSLTVCAGSVAVFSVGATGSGLTYQWRNGTINLINSGSVSGVNTPILNINPVGISDTASNYNVIISGICSPNDTSIKVSLKVNALPVIISGPADQTVCAGASVSFSVNATGTGLNYQWRKGALNLINGGTVSGANLATLVINPVNSSDAGSDYNVIVSGTCSPGDTSFNVSLTVNPIPLAFAGSNSPVCLNNPIDLTAQTVQGGTYNWTSTTGFSSTLQNPVITSASHADAGTYSLTVSALGCTSVPSTLVMIIFNCDSADVGVVKTVNNAHPIIGHEVVFTIVATNYGPNTANGVLVKDSLLSGYTYVSSSTTTGTYNPSNGDWTIGTLSKGASEQMTITATVTALGNYLNTATITSFEIDSNLANNTSSVITYPTDFFIPEGFSPNGDGINDVFVIRGIVNYPQNTILIYNRWGDQVFEASPYQSTWNGTSTMGLRVGGSELPTGTYFYLLNLGDGSAMYKGTIYLNR